MEGKGEKECCACYRQIADHEREERCNFNSNQGRAAAWEVVTSRGGEQLFIEVWSSG